ncbi:DegT/DnrJ/EryC1/StrS family aminotransferase [Actinokineospora guangxiensis]|uniref:DegT/DnrJ/EryC1/StrS family aminotransferase n=1 Tax=Actinokineospora guangxiensis TaxID=1490288 RepID=A0ABW0EUZ9_9PSEU
MTAVPYFPPDLADQDRDLLLETVRRVGADPAQTFALGHRGAAFEAALRGHTGAAEVLTCASGTDALLLVLRAMDIGPGDEVVVPALGCAAQAAAVTLAGATPVFADVHPWTMVVEPYEVEMAITDATAAIMPAHLFSVMADMPTLAALAERHGVRLVEDSAAAQGGVLAGVPAGRWGEAGVFSFARPKPFGAVGGGGAVLTDDPAIAEAVRALRDHGQDGRTRFVHHAVGRASRIDEIVAEYQLHRLAGLAERLERRARIAEHYTEQFSDLVEHGVQAPPPALDGTCFSGYCLLAERRDDLRRHLAVRGVGTHVPYPTPLPGQPAFAPHARGRRFWPHAELAGARMLALPVHPHLTDTQVEHIADAVRSYREIQR